MLAAVHQGAHTGVTSTTFTAWAVGLFLLVLLCSVLYYRNGRP